MTDEATPEMTPERWLKALIDRREKSSRRVNKLFDYASGRPPMPRLTDSTAASWLKQQELATTDAAGLAVRPAAARIKFAGASVVGNPTMTEQLRSLTRITRFAGVVNSVVHDALISGRAFFLLSSDDDGPLLSAENELTMTVAEDPLRPWKARAAVKFLVDDVLNVEKAFVWTGTHEAVFQRPLKSSFGRKIPLGRAEWTKLSEKEMDSIPVTIFQSSDSGVGCFENHLPLIDSLHQFRLLHAVIMIFLAWKQTAIIKKDGDAAAGGSPDGAEDEEEGGLDLSAFLSPGALTELSGDVSIWQSSGVTNDVVGMAIKDKYREFAEQTGTPLAAFSSDGANQSAEAANAQRESLINRCEAYAERLIAPMEAMLVKLAEVALEGYAGEVISASLTPVAYASLRERMDALNLAKSAGIPFRVRTQLVGGFTPEQIADMETELLFEQALAGVNLTPVTDPEQPEVASNGNTG